MAYADKKGGKHTGSFVGEAVKLKKKRRFKTLQDAKDYETFCKLMGREPPTIEDGHESTGAPTFAQVAAMARAAGGPRGKWRAERDKSLVQRLDYVVGIIGAYECHRVTRSILKKIADSLERAKAPGKSRMLGPASKNRYLSVASGVLRYAVNEEIIDTMPSVPWLNERDDRKARDILQLGQDQVVLKLMREAGNALEALCVEVLLETGLRSGELVERVHPDQITIEQVEDEDGTFVPCGVLTLHKGQTKNNTDRCVLFSPELARQIKAALAAGPLPKGDKLLSTFQSACERAGYTGNLVIHSLRHTRNTRLFKAGVDQSQRMEMLGHLSKEANDIYTHRDLQDQLQAVKKVKSYAGKRGAKASEAPSQVLDFPKAGAG